MRLSISILFFTLLGTLAHAQPWTYQDLLKEAEKNNYQIKQENLMLEKAMADLRASKAGRLPDLGASVYGAVNNGRALNPITYQYVTQSFLYETTVLQSQWKVFEGGKQGQQIKRDKAQLEQQGLNLENQKQAIAQELFYQMLKVYELKEKEALLQRKVDLLKQQLDKAQLLVDNGRATASTVYELGIEIDRLDNQKEELAFYRELAELQLKSISGIPLDSPLMLAVPAQQSLDTVGQSITSLEQIVETSISFRQAGISVNIAEYNKRMVAGGGMPSVSLIGGIGSAYSSFLKGGTVDSPPFGEQFENNLYTNVAVSVYVPLFTRFQQRTTMQKARLEIQYKEQVRNQRQTEMMAMLSSQNSQILHSASRYQSLSHAVEGYSKVLKELEQRFASGRVDVFQLLFKQQQLLDLEQQLIDLKYANLKASKTIELVKTGSIDF